MTSKLSVTKYLLLAMTLGLSISPGQVQLTVPGSTKINLAGQPAGTAAGQGLVAPANSPAQVNIPLVAGQPLQIFATGAVDGTPPTGAGGSFSPGAQFGVAGITSLGGALIGVFLADTERPVPPAVVFQGDTVELVRIEPLIQQPFVVGTGKNSRGETKAFVVPQGATRLFLAVNGGTTTSKGSLQVTVSPTPIPDEALNPIRVSGTSSLYLVGQSPGTANGRFSAPTNTPRAVDVPLVPGQSLRMVATGSVEGYSPEGGGGNLNRGAQFGIGGLGTRSNALVGVFLADTLRGVPPTLDFSGTLKDAVTLQPLLQQPFLIGAGYTAAGNLKEFVVPQGATRLFIAVNGSEGGAGYFVVTVSPNASTTPVISAAGVVRGAGFGGGPVAPGSIASIFGTSLSDSVVSSEALPLPVLLNKTRVYFNLQPAPFYFVAPGQINVQAPWELMNETSAQVVVTRNGAASLPVTVQVSAVNPGVFTIKGDTGVLVANSTGQLVDATSGAARGDALVIYSSGLGAVAGEVQTGSGASATSLQAAKAKVQCVVQISGQEKPLQVLFAGLAPTFVGVNQVNVLLPGDLPTGVGTLKLRIGDRESNSVAIAIR